MPPASQVGVNYLTFAAQSPPCTAPIAGKCRTGRVALPVYNVVPFEGVPSMVAFLTETGATFIVGSLDPVNQHVIFTIDPVHAPQAGPPESPPVIGSRLVFNGRAGNGTYLTMPSNCAGGQITKLNVDSWDDAGRRRRKLSKPRSARKAATKCPFKPTISVTPQGGAVDSPEATTVNVWIPWSASERNRQLLPEDRESRAA